MPFNFYELYNLLNENTVSQEFKKLKPDISKIYPNPDVFLNEFSNKFSHLNMNAKSMDRFFKWFCYIMFAFDILKEKNPTTKIAQYINNISDVSSDYLAANIDDQGNLNPQLYSKFNNISFKYEDFANLINQYHQDLASGKINIPGSKDGEVVLTFPDGYKWLNLGRGYCKIEGKAGKHCGNVGAKFGDSILSLRDNKNYVHLTFILNNGILEERKAKANTKPTEKHHPYIVELLKLPIIKGLGKGRYLPENDFKLSDLSEEHAKELLKTNPEMEKVYYIEKLMNWKAVPTEKLDALSNHNDAFVRERVARYENTSVDTLEKLSNDKEIGVVSAVAGNENSSSKILSNVFYNFEKLMSNTGSVRTIDDVVKKLDSTHRAAALVVFMNLITNSNTPVEILSKMIDNKDEQIFNWARSTLLKRPDVPLEILEKLSRGDANNRADVAKNNSTPVEILIRLSKDGKRNVRKCVASNKNTPKEILIQLSNDKEKRVRDAAVGSLKRFIVN